MMLSPIQSIVSSDLFRYGVVPLISTFLVIFVKRESRSSPLKKEDFAVGIDLMVAAIFLYLVNISDMARGIADLNQAEPSSLASNLSPATPPQEGEILHLLGRLHDSVFILFLLIAGLWGTASFVRRSGWINTAEMHSAKGIGIPLGMGIVYLYAALLGMGK